MIEVNSIFGPMLSALCAFIGSWMAFSARLTRVETKLDSLKEEHSSQSDNNERIARLETRVDALEGK